jgi:hypothetical protein
MRNHEMRGAILSCTAALLLLAVPTTSFACTCGAISQETAAAESDVVFVGELVEISEFPGEWTPDGQVISSQGVRLRFRVIDMIKPAEQRSGEIEVWSGTGGSDCGLGFPAGSAYLIYATWSRDRDPKLGSGMCSRSAYALCALNDLKALGRDNPPYLQPLIAATLSDPEKAGKIPCVERPQLLTREHHEGEIPWQTVFPYARVWLTIDASGDLLDVALDRNAGYSVPAEREGAVLREVQGWKFKPATYQGRRVAVKIQWLLFGPRT